MPVDRAGLAIAVVDDLLYVIGGGHNIFTMDSTTVMQYTPLVNPGVDIDQFSVTPIFIGILFVVVGVCLGLLVYIIKKN